MSDKRFTPTVLFRDSATDVDQLLDEIRKNTRGITSQAKARETIFDLIWDVLAWTQETLELEEARSRLNYEDTRVAFADDTMDDHEDEGDFIEIMADIARLEGNRREHSQGILATLQRCPFTRDGAEFVTRKTLVFVSEIMEYSTQPLPDDFLRSENKDLRDQMSLEVLGQRCDCPAEDELEEEEEKPQL
ncbi:hypothetical protein HD806DRAFT_345859 [Xylariaceae sp. AK1471]|nr:hypothetical protein HD806DRAFT_345859 [Xylariaceae sp. AK1471]